MNYKICKSIITILENNDIRIISTEKGYKTEKLYTELEFYSDAGEDFVFSIWHKGTKASFIEGFCQYAADFDPDEHAELYIDMRGKNGVPDSIRALIDDADDIAAKLEKIADELREVR